MFKKLKTRIFLGYSAALLLFVLMAGLMFFNLIQVQQAVETLITQRQILPPVERIAFAVAKIEGSVAQLMLNKDPIALTQLQDSLKIYQDSGSTLTRLLTNPEEKEELNVILQLGEIIQQTTEKLTQETAEVNPKLPTSHLMAFMTFTQSSQLTNALDRLISQADQIQSVQEMAAKRAIERLRWIIVGGTFIFGLVAIGLSTWLSSRISGRITESMNIIAASASQIATTVEQQERTTVGQSNSVNKTTVTIEQLNVSSQQTTKQAEIAATRVREVLALVEQYPESLVAQDPTLKQIMNGISQQILRLSEQSNQIANISDLVGDIASQTNMLSLNAAVEAARAGEHGKGFGVVAAEIRKLAEQSKQSAKKIREIVGQIQRSMESSVTVTEQANQTVNKIVSAINEVAMSNQQISLSTQQQQTALQQIVLAMNEINRLAAQIAIGISQAKNTTKELNFVVQDFQDMV
jgi:methyl-accepting chemotaxis protein